MERINIIRMEKGYPHTTPALFIAGDAVKRDTFLLFFINNRVFIT